jgi:hypothetical protein
MSYIENMTSGSEHMMYTESQTPEGGVWVALHDNSRITCRVDDADSAELVVRGSVEVSLGLTEHAMRRCAEVVGQALEQMHAARERTRE